MKTVKHSRKSSRDKEAHKDVKDIRKVTKIAKEPTEERISVKDEKETGASGPEESKVDYESAKRVSHKGMV